MLSLPSPVRADAVDDYVLTEMQKQHIPGLSLAVMKDGKIVKTKGYGLANVELKVPATTETVYEIGSVTKQFTAAAILMLVEGGKVGLDDKIGTYVPNLPETWQPITIRHLLTHTSGLKNMTSIEDFPKRMVVPVTPTEAIKLMVGYPLEFAPGEKWAYSNTGYFLLGMVIEKASGKSYGAFMKERIFTPLQMTATCVNDENDIIPNRASGYSWAEGSLHNAAAISMTWPYAAGAIASTVTDLAKWDAALYGDTLLKKTSRDAMWTPAKLNGGAMSGYGFGWGVSQVSGHRNVSHGGGIPGFVSYVSRFPDDGWTVAVLTNQDSGANPSAIGRGVIGRYFAAVAPPTYAPIPDKDPQKTALVKKIYEGAAKGEVDSSLFTPRMASVVAAQLKQGLTDKLHSLGVLQSITLVEQKTDGPDQSFRYRLTYKEGSMLTLCSFDKEGKIAGMALSAE